MAEREQPWNVSIMRVLNPDGSLLWPGHSTLAEYQALWTSGGSAYFNAIQMQDPSGLAGEVFKQEWFRYYCHPSYVDPAGLPASELLARGMVQRILPSAEERLVSLQASDLAISKKETADYYARASAWASRTGELFIEDVWQNRLTGKQMVRDIVSNAEKRRARMVGIEANAFQSLVFEAAQEQSRMPYVPLEVDSDKVLRARPVAVRYEGGKVYHLYGARWLTMFEAQLLGFPGGAHDDMVDALSLVYELVRRWNPSEFNKLAEMMQDLKRPSKWVVG